jgi:hypothetical protein
VEVNPRAGRSKEGDIGLAPAAQPAHADCERAFYSRSFEQARFVREGLWDAVDRQNVAEEIGSLGREQFNKLVSALRVLLLHFLEWDHRQERRSRSWVLSVEAQRDELADVIGDNPGLKPRIGEAIDRAYRKTRIEAAQETGLEKSQFPEQCPYSFDQIVKRDLSL